MALLQVDDELHVWLIDLRRPDASDLLVAETMSADERGRAAKFVSERDRMRFVVAHSALRRILSLYLEAVPTSIAFRIGRYGKPALAGVPDANIRFNLSHSSDFALCAVASACDVGVDIEQIQPVAVVGDVAGQFFSADEKRMVAELDGDAQAEVFTRIWVRKEACLKAAGRGIGGDLAGFSVGLEDSGVSVPTADERGVIWALQELRAPGGYCAAVATSAARAVRMWRFEDFLSRAWAAPG